MGIIQALGEGATTHTLTPAPTGSHSVDLFVTIFVACIAALPGIGGLIYTWRKRKDVQRATATDFGTKLAETAFKNMESQVARLTIEQEKWDEDRAQWDRDKQTLVKKITELTTQLQVTNQYLQLLLTTLDVHGIDRPSPPLGFRRS